MGGVGVSARPAEIRLAHGRGAIRVCAFDGIHRRLCERRNTHRQRRKSNQAIPNLFHRLAPLLVRPRLLATERVLHAHPSESGPAVCVFQYLDQSKMRWAHSPAMSTRLSVTPETVLIRSAEHRSDLQSLMSHSYAVFSL